MLKTKLNRVRVDRDRATRVSSRIPFGDALMSTAKRLLIDIRGLARDITAFSRADKKGV